MNNVENLTHSEIMNGLSYCFRELIQTEISHRNMPNIINRAKATAAIVTATHREELMELKRTGAIVMLQNAKPKKLRKK